MKATIISERIVQLTRWPLLFPVNVYLVRDGAGLTLIDAGMPGSEASILRAAQSIGSAITRILLTHAHGDHTGSLDALRAALPAADVLVTSRSARFLAGDRTLEPGETRGRPRGSWRTCRTEPSGTIKPGDRVGPLQVIAAPGHSPDHVAYLDTRDGTLIAGDAFQTRGGVAVSGTLVPTFPFPAMATWDKPTAVASARALRDLEPARLAVGHGAVISEPLAAMERAIAVAERRLAGEPRHAG